MINPNAGPGTSQVVGTATNAPATTGIAGSGGPRVLIVSVAAEGSITILSSFFGIDDPNFRGGARVALGNVNGTGKPDLAVAAGFLGGPRIALFDGDTLLANPTRLTSDFFAFPGTDAATLRNGAYVAIGDINGDGFGDLIFGGGPGGAPRVFVLSGKTSLETSIQAAQADPIANFFVNGNTSERGGVRVASVNAADGDSKAELIVGSGEGLAANVRIYLGKNFISADEPTIHQDLGVFGSSALSGGVYVG